MKCPKCGNKLTLRDGQLYCSNCDSNRTRKLAVKREIVNDLEYFRVVSAENIIIDKYLLRDELQQLLNKVEVKIIE